MKCVIFGFILIFVSSSGFSQTTTAEVIENSKWNLHLSGGIALPVGKFCKVEALPDDYKTQNINFASDAEIGWDVELGTRCLFGKHFGIAMDIYWSSFTPAKRDASAYFEDPYFYFPGTGTASELGKYSFLGMLIGGTYETSYKKFGMGVKLLAGIQRAQSPEVKMTTQAKSIVYFLEPIVTYNISQASMVSYDIAYKCEIFAKHRLNSRFHMLYSVIFNNSSCHFSGGTLEIHRDELAVHEEDTYSQEFTKQISYLSFRIGAGINL